MSFSMDMKIGPFTLFQVIGLIGALLGVIALFMNWWCNEYTSIVGTVSDNYSGIDIWNEGDGETWTRMAVFTCIVAAIALILNLVSAFTDKLPIAKFMPIITLILGILMIVFTICYYTHSETVLGITVKASDYVGTGVWIALVGGILVTIAGLIDIIPALKKQ